jgi:hypothetical protein
MHFKLIILCNKNQLPLSLICKGVALCYKSEGRGFDSR